MLPARHGDWSWSRPQGTVTLKCQSSEKWKRWARARNISHGWPGFPSERSSSSNASAADEKSNLFSNNSLLQQELNHSYKGTLGSSLSYLLAEVSMVPLLCPLPPWGWRSAAFPLQTQLPAPVYLHFSSQPCCSQAETWSENERNLSLQQIFTPCAVFAAEPPHPPHVTKSFLWCEIWFRITSGFLLN